jgi:hypothetical protein
MPPISKTTFLDFLFCPKNLWLKLHKPELLSQFTMSEYEQHLLEEGNEVERYARKLFEGGIEVQAYGALGVIQTEELIKKAVSPSTGSGLEKSPMVIFQATFINDGFLARSDVLEYDAANGTWNLYEVKGTSAVREGGKDKNHLDDLAFQASILRRANVPMNRCFVMHLNNTYVLQGDLDLHQLFTVEDVTDKVQARLQVVEAQMETALDYLSQTKEPVGGCECLYVGRNNHCTTFAYSNPQVPGYSIHDLSRIGSSKKKLLALVESKTFDLLEVPQDMELSDIQLNQIAVHRRGEPMIDQGGIRAELNDLPYPLYFFDYETLAPAVPMFNGYRPYQRIPFQFSLHILREKGGELEHVEYLHMESSDPAEAIVKLLDQHILPGGTLVSWNKSFEAGVNKEMAERLPQYAPVLERLNSMLYDLKDVFSKQYYVHPEFKGSVSIKKVLPALVPDLTYAELDIHGGAQASDSWRTMLKPDTMQEEKDVIAKSLKIYCGLDTFAMYKIWAHLQSLIAAH